MKQLSYIFIFIVLLFACTNEIEPTVETIEKLELSLSEKIKLFLDEAHLNHLGIDIKSQKTIIDFYEKRNFDPKWINEESLNQEGIILNSLLTNKLQYGLPEKRYDFIKCDTNSKIEREIYLTALLAYMTNDIEKGVFQKDTALLQPLSVIPASKLDSLTKFKVNHHFHETIIKSGKKDTNYTNFAFALYNFCNTYPLDTTRYFIKPEKFDSINSLNESKKALLSKGYIQDLEIDSLNFRKTIEKYQQVHNLTIDGKIGMNTAEMLSESTYSKIKRAAISLDKMRTKSVYNSTYIRINLPEYTLRFIYDDTLRSEHRVIIGSTKTPSPTLTSKIYKIVFFPYWHVPYSIASKEILPHLQEDTSYLRRNNYKIFKNKEEVDPSNINWEKIRENNFPFRVRQDYGPTNSLGLIKLSFHNQYWVYVHDTPNKRLFNREVRAMSHGCIRCDSVQNLARVIFSCDRKMIEKDTLNVDSLLVRNQHENIQLQTKIPIFIEYKTVILKNDSLIFLRDIYKRDKKYKELFQ
jgi:L,D-transpeptidase YcbB